MAQDPEGFVENGGWDFLNQEAGDSGDDDDEEDGGVLSPA